MFTLISLSQELDHGNVNIANVKHISVAHSALSLMPSLGTGFFVCTRKFSFSYLNISPHGQVKISLSFYFLLLEKTFYTNRNKYVIGNTCLWRRFCNNDISWQFQSEMPSDTKTHILIFVLFCYIIY